MRLLRCLLCFSSDMLQWPASAVPTTHLFAQYRSRDLLASLQLATKILPAYERMFGVPYPLAKLDLVAIPDFAAGAALSGLKSSTCPHADVSLILRARDRTKGHCATGD